MNLKSTFWSISFLSTLVLLSCNASGSELLIEKVKPFPKFGPIVRDLTQSSITLAGQGKIPSGSHCSGDKTVEGVAAICTVDHGHKKGEVTIHRFPMNSEDRNVGFLTLSNLKPNQQYQISIGYIEHKEDVQEDTHNHGYSWKKSHKVDFKTPAVEPLDSFSFLMGSCRRIGRATPIMKRLGDPIFQGMDSNIEQSSHQGIPTNFIFFGGDQIYADALGENAILMPANEFSEYAGLYEKAFSQEHFRHLTTTHGIPVLMARDDHELWNNANAEEEAKRPQQSADAYKAYALYQRPFGANTPNYWYTTSNGAEMFVTDTRSERFPSQHKIMSDAQMQALKDWLSAASRSDRIKIIATSVPMFLLDSDDSWSGFMAQKHELVNYIVRNNIKHVMVVSGDAHCQNDAEFKVYDTKDQDTGHRFVEVLVSGLYAISRDKADKLQGETQALQDGEGYILKTEAPLEETLTKDLFARITGNHVTKEVTVTVQDKKNKNLKTVRYQL
jgi:hypothetical protein